MSPDCQRVAMIRGSLVPLANSNSIMSMDGQSSDFQEILTSKQAQGLLGVPFWHDNNTLFSYVWNKTKNGWRVIRMQVDNPGRYQEIELGAPDNFRDLMPVTY